MFAASLWGTAGIFVRTIENYKITEMQIVLFRALFSVICLAIIIFLKDKKLFKIKLKDLWLFVSAGIFSIVLFNFCYYKTMALTSLSVAAVLLYTAPFFVVIISLFLFKQKLTIKKSLACIMAFIGCCFVTGAIGSGEKIGINALIFGLLTGFGYSLYTIFSRLLLDKGYNSFTITFYTFLFAFLGCLPLADVKNAVSVCFDTPFLLLLTFLMAIFNTVIPYIFYTKGLCGVDTSAAPIIAMIEPIVATVVGTVLYKEPFTLSGLFGIILVLISVLVLNLKGNKIQELKIKANAKINLSLSVLSKRDDGYHEMDTVMQNINLYDIATIKKSNKISVICGEFGGEDNIAYKTAKLFFEKTDINGGAQIIIEKNIPSSAGLGGGSADAAAVIVGLDKLYQTNLSYEEKIDIAVSLGADVPFFIMGGTARARGIGEKLEALAPFENCYIIIAKSDNKPSTGEMFKRLDNTDYIKPDINKTVNAINNRDYGVAILTFENSFCSLWENNTLESLLNTTSADKVALSGSGPSFFALYKDKETLKKAENILKQNNIAYFVCKPTNNAFIFEE